MSDSIKRRTVLKMATAGVLSLNARWGFGLSRNRPRAKVMGAFVYPPTKQLDEAGYYSWPGSSFDAEGHQRQFSRNFQSLAQGLEMDLVLEEAPIDTGEQTEAYIQKIKQEKPDGLLLVSFKKGHWGNLTTIIEKTGVPAIVYAPLGGLLMPMIRELHDANGVYMISSLQNMGAVNYGLKMVRAQQRMRTGTILNITTTPAEPYQIPGVGTTIRTISNQQFADACREVDENKAGQLARRFLDESLKRVEPSRQDVVDGARTYFALKQLVEQEQADAMMMNCLPGLRKPHQHVPPCMGFMELRNEGIPAGCESDLDATLTLMLIEHLFEKPGFQHNPAADTERNLYFCAHCTSATKMNGRDQPAEPYVLRNHAEAGWGCVPQVLLRPEQEITITKFLSRENPMQLLLYSGEIQECPENPPAGGCRTNAITTIRELEDVCDLKGHHLCMCYGDHTQSLRDYAQLSGMAVVS